MRLWVALLALGVGGAAGLSCACNMDSVVPCVDGVCALRDSDPHLFLKGAPKFPACGALKQDGRPTKYFCVGREKKLNRFCRRTTLGDVCYCSNWDHCNKDMLLDEETGTASSETRNDGSQANAPDTYREAERQRLETEATERHRQEKADREALAERQRAERERIDEARRLAEERQRKEHERRVKEWLRNQNFHTTKTTTAAPIRTHPPPRTYPPRPIRTQPPVVWEPPPTRPAPTRPPTPDPRRTRPPRPTHPPRLFTHPPRPAAPSRVTHPPRMTQPTWRPYLRSTTTQPRPVPPPPRRPPYDYWAEHNNARREQSAVIGPVIRHPLPPVDSRNSVDERRRPPIAPPLYPYRPSTTTSTAAPAPRTWAPILPYYYTTRAPHRHRHQRPSPTQPKTTLLPTTAQPSTAAITSTTTSSSPPPTRLPRRRHDETSPAPLNLTTSPARHTWTSVPETSTTSLPPTTAWVESSTSIRYRPRLNPLNPVGDLEAREDDVAPTEAISAVWSVVPEPSHSTPYPLLDDFTDDVGPNYKEEGFTSASAVLPGLCVFLCIITALVHLL